MSLQTELTDLGYSEDAAEELAGHVEAMSPSSTPGQSHEGESDLLEKAKDTADMLFSICDGTFAGDNGELHAQALRLQEEIQKVSSGNQEKHAGPCCEEWDEHIPVIDTQMKLSHSMTPLPTYEGPGFEYCPFCGAPTE